MPASSKAERKLIAQIASNISWANTTDRTSRTSRARKAFNDRFLYEVDPDGILPEPERHRRAEHARKAHFARLALKSVQSRQKSKSSPQTRDGRERSGRQA